MFLATQPAPKQRSADHILATKYHGSGFIIFYTVWENKMTASFQNLVYSPPTITSYHVMYHNSIVIQVQPTSWIPISYQYTEILMKSIFIWYLIVYTSIFSNLSQWEDGIAQSV
jgi:hypothetical protein